MAGIFSIRKRWNSIKNIHQNRYILSRELSSSANYLALVCPRNTKFVIECYTSWAVSDVDDDPLSHNPTMGPFISLEDAFQTSVNCRNIVLDKFKIPEDNCKLIAAAIEQGTTIAVCDGSFDPNDRLGTVAFMMVANKKDKMH